MGFVLRFVIFALFLPVWLLGAEKVEFVIIIPSYNNERFCVANLESVVKQDYPHFKVKYVNDCSTDHTQVFVENFIKEKKLKGKVELINNDKRVGALANIYRVAHQCKPRQVLITCDGDDFFASPQVLSRVAKEYQDKNVWMTYGDFRTTRTTWGSCCAEIPTDVALSNSFRTHDWVASHLRTFYAKLFQKIKKKDLMWNGKFFPMTWDMAMMFPMMEMAALGHFRYIKDILYIYNVDNPICDYRINAQLQNDLDKHIRSLTPYKPLKKLF